MPRKNVQVSISAGGHTSAPVDLATFNRATGEIVEGAASRHKPKGPQTAEAFRKEALSLELAIDAKYHKWQAAKKEASQLHEEYELAVDALRDHARGAKEPKLPFETADDSADEDDER